MAPCSAAKVASHARSLARCAAARRSRLATSADRPAAPAAPPGPRKARGTAGASGSALRAVAHARNEAAREVALALRAEPARAEPAREEDERDDAGRDEPARSNGSAPPWLRLLLGAAPPPASRPLGGRCLCTRAELWRELLRDPVDGTRPSASAAAASEGDVRLLRLGEREGARELALSSDLAVADWLPSLSGLLRVSELDRRREPDRSLTSSGDLPLLWRRTRRLGLLLLDLPVGPGLWLRLRTLPSSP